jgi:4'-phosphopantetheinyl transferase
MRRDGLDKGEVHLWLVRLEASEVNFQAARSWLSADEAARAARFYFERHGRAYILGRAVLRVLIGRYLGIDPSAVRFVYGPQGKPALEDAECSLRFNASNSGDLAACAFTRGCEIGVDVEQHRDLRDMEQIAHRFFSPEEASELLALPEPNRAAGFFNCWTRKEAYIKAKGGGLSIPLASFQVTLKPGVSPRMVSIDGSAEAARGWTVHHFDPAPDFRGAIAYADQARELRSNPVMPVDALLAQSE